MARYARRFRRFGRRAAPYILAAGMGGVIGAGSYYGYRRRRAYLQNRRNVVRGQALVRQAYRPVY